MRASLFYTHTQNKLAIFLDMSVKIESLWRRWSKNKKEKKETTHRGIGKRNKRSFLVNFYPLNSIDISIIFGKFFNF